MQNSLYYNTKNISNETLPSVANVFLYCNSLFGESYPKNEK